MPAREFTNSPAFNTDGSLDATYIVWDVFDAAQAQDTATGISPDVYHGRFRTPRPAVRKFGDSLWEVVYTYKPIEEQQPEQPPTQGSPTAPVIEFDTSGGTQHITSAISGTKYPNDAPDVKLAIGVGRDGVEGVDIVIPKLALSVTRRWHFNDVTGAYVKNLSRLTGKVNQVAYSIAGAEYAAEELLFLGARGTRGATDFQITYQFEASENRPAFDIRPGLSVEGGKKGHDYLWVMFRKEETTKAVVEVPEFAYVAKVYESADFQQALGF